MATIRDVAKASGVSVTTVSFVLNNSPRPVSPETRRRVTEVARRMNYHPNAMARGLVQRRMNSIGILFSIIEPTIVTNNYANGILRGIFQESVDRGYDIHLFTQPWEGAENSAPRFRNKQTDGTLIVAPTIGSDMVSGLHSLGVPIVVLSTPTEIGGVAYVDVDNMVGAQMAAEHLLSLGHSRIAHLMGAPHQVSVFQRRDAFLKVLEKAGKPMPPEYLVGDSFQREAVYDTTRRLLSLPSRPTAIFTTNDDMAFVVLDVAQEMGIAVPEHLSVIGFDDYPMTARAQPGLTTIHHPLSEVGMEAAKLLIARIEGGVIESGAHLFAPKLVIRGTTTTLSEKIV